MDTLISYANTYQHFYKLAISSIFHTACGCVVGQQVAFNVGKNIRKQLYELCGTPLTRDKILNIDLTKIPHLTQARANLIINMANIDHDRAPNLVLEDYSKLVGFGKWTHDAVSILLNISDTINLSTDAYICKNLELYLNKSMTKTTCYNYILSANNNQTLVCYFLWRIKKTSIQKVKNNEDLTREDFL